jgi:hypothetical protein
MRPFKKADFADPKVRKGLSNFFGGIDLDDPQTQQYLRELTVPVSLLEQIQRVGQTASGLIKEMSSPTMVLQGTQDEVVDPQGTRKLLQRLPVPIHYCELVGVHDLLDPKGPTWPQLEQFVLNFIDSFTNEGQPENESEPSDDEHIPNSRSAYCNPHSDNAGIQDETFDDQGNQDDH